MIIYNYIAYFKYTNVFSESSIMKGRYEGLYKRHGYGGLSEG
jgi:hypothetical protein